MKEISDTTFLLIFVLGLVLLFVSMRCSFSCSVPTEGFMYRGLVDYVFNGQNPSYYDDGESTRSAPVSESTLDAQHVSLAGSKRTPQEHGMEGCSFHS